MDYVFTAKSRAEKKEEKLNIIGRVLDAQETNFFLSMCGNYALLKFRRFVVPKNLLETPLKEIKVVIQNSFSPKE